MSKLAESLRGVLDQLPVTDRASLAEYLIQSLDEVEMTQAGFDEELAKRLLEIRSGSVVGIPAEEVFRELREKYS